MKAYRRLGARVVTVACCDQPGYAPGSSWWRDYRRLTPELESAPRFFAGVSFARFLRPSRFKRLALPYWHGDGATMRAGFAEASDLSDGLAAERVDFVHCNHFFCMPVAHRVAGNGSFGAPIALDTIDVQARQFDLINDASRWVLPPRTSFEAMLAQEIEAMRPAAALLHLNLDEKTFFEERMPGAPHHLLYPAVRDMPGRPGGRDILIVASNNAANVESLLWFLREVFPRPLTIAGNVDAGVRAKDAGLFERHREAFAGRVDDLGALYARAKLVLLPTIDGTGLSIKAVEAMSSGLPLIATRLAFRGMAIEPANLRNVALADDAEAFAAALRQAADGPASNEDPMGSDTRRAYDDLFSEAAYARNLARIVLPLVAA